LTNLCSARCRSLNRMIRTNTTEMGEELEEIEAEARKTDSGLKGILEMIAK